MTRSRSLLFLLGILGTVHTASPASAQVFAGGGVRLPGVPTYGNMNFRYRNSAFFSVGSPIGPNISFGYSFSGPIGLGIQRNFYYNNHYSPSFLAPSAGGYIAGGTRPNDAAARDFGMAQRQAGLKPIAPPRNAIYDQWAYEKFGVGGVTGVKPGENAPDALIKALNSASEAEIASGEALNHIVVGVVAAEKKGKAASAFLPPNLLAQVRFAGSPTAEAVNLLRQSSVTFPAAFESGPVADLKPALERDLAALAGPAQLGKPVDPAKIQQFTTDVTKARAVLEPAIRDLEFTDATAARRFLNQLDGVATALKANPSGLIDPKWATEGVSVADLVKNVTKNKLLFGPAPKGEEDAYVALHRGLAAYLFTLNESAKPAPKK